MYSVVYLQIKVGVKPKTFLKNGFFFRWRSQTSSLPSSLTGVNVSEALTTSWICCCSSRMAHPHLLWLEGVSTATTVQSPHMMFHCYSVTSVDSCPPPGLSSPRRPSVSSAVTSSDTTEPHYNFSGASTELGSVIFPTKYKSSELMIWVSVVCVK